jgi:16S rRNA (uracil1498-N3)-methyltransferase
LALVLDVHATEKLTEIVSKVAHIKSVVLVVGPEGGLTDEELLDMSKEGAKLVRLGRPIFRSAHAGIAAVAAVSVALGLW